MNVRVVISLFLILVFSFCISAQTPAPSGAANVWNAITAPVIDLTKFVTVKNVEIVRDRIHITLKEGGIQFAQPVNGVVFGAAFRGTGHVSVDPPNAIEAQQLRLFVKQDKIAMPFSEEPAALRMACSTKSQSK